MQGKLPLQLAEQLLLKEPFLLSARQLLLPGVSAGTDEGLILMLVIHCTRSFTSEEASSPGGSFKFTIDLISKSSVSTLMDGVAGDDS